MYDIVVYSSMQKSLLIFIIDILQKEKEFFSICITHETINEPKSIFKFLKEGRDPSNTFIIDHDPEVVAYNSDFSLPIIKFEGKHLLNLNKSLFLGLCIEQPEIKFKKSNSETQKCKDSTLLYL